MHRCFPTARCARRRGGATTLALLLLLLLSVLGLGLASTTLEAMRLTHLQQRSSLAFHLAESGAERALRYLRVQATPPTQTAAFQPFGGSAIALGSGTYEVTIDPDDNNPNLSLKRYLIRGVGRALGRRETVELYAQMSTFGEYAFFFDRWPSGAFLDNNSVVDGPAHLNATDGVPMNLRWSSSATAPIFQNGLLTTAASRINYLAPSTAPTTEAQYQKVFELGSAGYRLGVSTVSLPASTDEQKSAAWGSTGSYPSSNGVYVPNTGSSTSAGIYIRGAVNSLRFGVNGSRHQEIVVEVGSEAWTITINRPANTTTLRKTAGAGSPSSTTWSGVTNGVIYATEGINSLGGELADSHVTGSTILSRNAFTLATDTLAGRDRCGHGQHPLPHHTCRERSVGQHGQFPSGLPRAGRQ
ncbi:MAG: hypothetical protein FJX77_05825 [Armatimonadetes bacterium]|nr:hypothetical protein [Armatimonadota bacterium]